MSDDRIRTTISLTPEAHAIFKRMADAGNMSVSRCMGDWLSDTADAAQMITLKMEEAKNAPMRVLREMQDMLVGIGQAVVETGAEIAAIREQGRTARAVARTERTLRTVAATPVPPSSNTGGKSPKPSTPRASKGANK